MNQDQLYAQTFQGKPVNILPLIKSQSDKAAEKSNINFKQITNKISKIKPVNGRLEKIGKIKNKSTVILDYAHTPDALKTCLENIKEQFKDKKISIVFGCGGNRDQSKRRLMGKIANYYCHRIYLNLIFQSHTC